jgi:hypothetical protein
MKIKACPYILSILMKIHGEGLIDKIISLDCDVNFLAELENTVSEIESFKKNNKLPNNNNNNNNTSNNNHVKNNNNNKQNKNYQFENEQFAEDLHRETNMKSEALPLMRKVANANQIQRNPSHVRQNSNISGSRSDLENLILGERNYSTKNNNTQASREMIRRSHSKSTFNVSGNSKSRSKGKIDFFEDSLGSEAKFEQVLRKYGGKQMSGKVFMNYCRKAGDFFDPTLQKGGNSALDSKEESRKRSGSRRRSGNNNNNSVSISYSQNNNNI